jgi:hypothetical protein
MRTEFSFGEGCMSEEGEKINRAFDRSRSRLVYLNIGLAVVLVLAGVIEICIMLLHE